MNQFEKIVVRSKEYLTRDYSETILEALLDCRAYAYGSAVEGEIAEFGTMSGKSASILATGVLFNNMKFSNKSGNIDPKKLLLFDSFVGLPEVHAESIDATSTHVKNGSWGPGTCRGLTPNQLEELVRSILSPQDKFQVVEGWYDEVLATFPMPRLSMVHIDCDLYSSTSTVLHNLFDNQRITEGCVILFDDFFCDKARRHVGEQRAWNEIKSRFNVEATNFRNYGPSASAYIVHNYSAPNLFCSHSG
jgi:O-methyltransferase